MNEGLLRSVGHSCSCALHAAGGLLEPWPWVTDLRLQAGPTIWSHLTSLDYLTASGSITHIRILYLLLLYTSGFVSLATLPINLLPATVHPLPPSSRPELASGTDRATTPPALVATSNRHSHQHPPLPLVQVHRARAADSRILPPTINPISSPAALPATLPSPHWDVAPLRRPPLP